MAKKLYDVTVKTGTYMKDGQEKARYEQVGSVFEGQSGPFMVMKRTFSPAGVPFQEGSDSIFLSLFEPRDDQQQGQRQRQAAPQQRSGGQRDDFDQDIPFAPISARLPV